MIQPTVTGGNEFQHTVSIEANLGRFFIRNYPRYYPPAILDDAWKPGQQSVYHEQNLN